MYRVSDDDTLPKAWCLPIHLELFPEVKIAVSGERLGRALPSMLNISINYLRPVSVKGQVKSPILHNTRDGSEFYVPYLSHYL